MERDDGDGLMLLHIPQVLSKVANLVISQYESGALQHLPQSQVLVSTPLPSLTLIINLSSSLLTQVSSRPSSPPYHPLLPPSHYQLPPLPSLSQPPPPPSWGVWGEKYVLSLFFFQFFMRCYIRDVSRNSFMVV